MPAIVEACQDPEISRWTMVPAPYGEDDARHFLTDETNELRLAIVDPSSDAVVGSIGIRQEGGGRGEIGYWVAAGARGRGIATRAVRLVAAYGFENLGLARIQLMAEPENVASWRVAERAGFTRDGLLRSWTDMKGRRPDFYMYSLLPGELA